MKLVVWILNTGSQAEQFEFWAVVVKLNVKE